MKKLFIPVFLSLMLSSCAMVKGAELSRRLIIEAIGIDKKDGVYAVTLQTLDTHSAGAGSDPSSGGDLVKPYVFTGLSVGEALSRVQSSTGLVPLYSQARVIVLGMDTAKGDVSEPLDFFLREYNARSDVLLAVAQEDAYKIVTADLGSALPDAVILEDALNYGSDNGFCYAVRLFKFMNLILSRSDTAYCPVIGLVDCADPQFKEPQVTGTAFFEDYSLSFTADEKITRGNMFLTDDVKKTSFTAKGNEGLYTLEAVSSGTKIKTVKTQKGFEFCIDVELKCDITEFLSDNFSGVGEKQARDAKKAGTDHIKKLITDSFNTLYYEKKADVCRFFRRVRLKYPSYADVFSENMYTHSFTNVEISVRLTIRRTGKESF